MAYVETADGEILQIFIPTLLFQSGAISPTFDSITLVCHQVHISILQDCRKILKFFWAIIIDGEGFVVIMAKNLVGLKAPSAQCAPLRSDGPDYRSSCP